MIRHIKRMDRRQFMISSSALLGASLLSRSSFGQAVVPVPVFPTRDAVLKFNSDGTPKVFKGNTVICHLPAQCRLRDEMSAIHEELVHASYARKVAPTPTESYHMTVFPGANDQERETYGWPDYVPKTASIEDCDRIVRDRMADAHFHCSVPLRVRVDVDATLARNSASALVLSPIDEAEEKKMRGLRDEIAAIYGFRVRGHDTYRFHMTMSYQMAPMTGEEWKLYQDMFSRHVKHIAATLPVIELGAPEYCTFDDMFRFEPSLILRCS